jgi:hypothetical protein
MAADVVPVNMGRYGGDRLAGQPEHLIVNIAVNADSNLQVFAG